MSGHLEDTDAGGEVTAIIPYGSALRRFKDHKPAGNPLTLADDHPAATEGHALFRKRIKHPDNVPRIFKSGGHSRKIGAQCVKGKWRGFPIFTLTLEERATCPRSCKHWADCYGNKMNWSVRLQHGRALEERIVLELCQFQQEFPRGFIIRLHVLGDFYSVPYVELWERAINLLPALRVFGYTAWQPTTEIGRAIKKLRDAQWDRFAVRFSDGNAESAPRTKSIRRKGRLAASIICPAQTEKTDCCGTCALCWSTRKTIAFLTH